MSKDFVITRSLEMRAPAAKIYALLQNFHEWSKWSPYERMDANMEKHYMGAEAGVGAKYAWVSKKAGTGEMEITSVQEPTEVKLDLKFSKPMRAHNLVTFTLVEQGEMTRVTWTMTGAKGWQMIVLGLFISMDKMIGKDFEAGLQNMRALVEAQA